MLYFTLIKIQMQGIYMRHTRELGDCEFLWEQIFDLNFEGVAEDIPTKPNISVPENSKVTTNNPIIKQVTT